jgi:FtsH-binding integral membrane protein
MTFYPSTTIVLFLVMLALIETGRILRRRTQRHPNSAIEGAAFALFGLLLAFTFSGAMTRYDDHRHLSVEEANTIDVAYRRLDLLPPASQPALRQAFREYAAVRAHRFDEVAESPQSIQAAIDTKRLLNEIWTHSIAACALPPANPECSTDATKLLLPALNAMIDITATRRNAYEMHPPAIVFLLLYVLAGGCALLAGFNSDSARRDWFYMILFALIVSLTIYATLDIEYPRLGFVHITTQDIVFTDLINSMK